VKTQSAAPVPAREAYQLLKDVALGIRSVQSLTNSSGAEEARIDIDGWAVILQTHDGALTGCTSCMAPDGRTGSLETWQRYGTDPVSLLSTWEHTQIEALLRTL
jgi:hypothetical protein